MRSSTVTVVLTAVLSALASAASSDTSSVFAVPTARVKTVITPQLSAFVKNALEEAMIPGLSMGIVRPDVDRKAAAETAAWGIKREDGGGKDMTTDTLFALVSCSKAFVVTSIGLLIDDFANGRNVTALPKGVTRFDWDTKVADLFPGEWGLADEWAAIKLNLHDAFSHMSGLPRHDFSYRPGDTPTDILQRLRILPPAYELREQWMYNNQMFMVGAHIVETFANTPYPKFVTSRVFGPLNMSSTTFAPSEAERTWRLTQSWTRGSRRIPFWFSDDVTDSLFAGPGGILSSATDMTKWLTVLLHAGVDPLTNATIIPPSVFTEMTTARVIVTGTPTNDTSILGYAMGWWQMSYRGHDILYHDGAMPGFSSLTAFLPNDGLGVVLLANMDEKQDTNMNILFRVVDEVLGLPPQTTVEQKSVAAHDIHAESQQQQHDSDSATPTPEPERSNSTEPLPLDLAAYAGTYNNTAYGSITFCSPSDTSSYCISVLNDFAPIEAGTYNNTAYGSITFCSPSDTSSYCTSVLNDFAPIEQASSASPHDSHRLYAAWPRVWSTHVRLEHTSGNSFSLLFPGLFPEGYGANHTPFEYWDSQNSVGRTEFVIEGDEVVAFAMITDEQAAAARAMRTDGTLRQIADAWFVKT